MKIDPDDLIDFREIISKLNQNYIYSLVQGEFTEDDVELLKQHMIRNLTQTEYERAKELFIEYSFVLEEI
jgi:hypothetical protein